MSKQSFEQWEARIEEIAGGLPYPPTPDIAAEIKGQLRATSKPTRATPSPWRLAGTAVVVLFIVMAGLLAVPQVRAAVVEFLQLGAVRIFLTEPTPTATALRPTAAPNVPPTATPLASTLDLAGETTLAEAQAQIDFPIRLPTSPADLGAPDRVYLQDLGGPLIILVWLKPDKPEQVQLSLHQFGSGSFAGKSAPRLIEETTVKGQPALWMEGAHLLQLPNGDYVQRRLVEGNVLVWVEEDITYRLETELSLDEAVQIAESLE